MGKNSSDVTDLSPMIGVNGHYDVIENKKIKEIASQVFGKRQ